MPRLRLGVLGFESFWLGIVAKLTGEYGNASGFKAAGIFSLRLGCPGSGCCPRLLRVLIQIYFFGLSMAGSGEYKFISRPLSSHPFRTDRSVTSISVGKPITLVRPNI